MNHFLIHTLRTTLPVLLLALACASQESDGTGAESHFVCSVDDDCTDLGPDYACVSGECQEVAPKPPEDSCPPNDPTPAPGCLSTTTCSPEVSARVEAFSSSTDALVQASVDMKAMLAVACAGIAGLNVPAEVTDDDVTTLCDAASAAIDAQFSAIGGVTLGISPGGCAVDAAAQFDCEANCNAVVGCDVPAPSLEERCPPGELSGECSAECIGLCRSEASATVACSGTCNGICWGLCAGTCQGICAGTCSAQNPDGTCSGTCDGACQGACDASCVGECEGECEYGSAGGCSGACKGECSVEFMAPQCEAELMPPSLTCEAAANCLANCSGQAALGAECTPPQVDNLAGGEALPAAFIGDFGANFPIVVMIIARAELVASAMNQVASEAGDIVGSLDVACAAEYAAVLTAKAQAAVEASASVNVSIQAAANVMGTASQ